MNKKGFIGITIVGTLGLIILAIIILMLILGIVGLLSWITNNFLLLIGGTIIVIGLFVAMKMPENMLTIILVFLLVGGGLIGLHYSGLVQETGLSADKINIEDEGERLRIVATPDSESYILKLNIDDINNGIKDEGFVASKGVEFTLTTEKFEEVYPLKKIQEGAFYTLESKDVGNAFTTLEIVGCSLSKVTWFSSVFCGVGKTNMKQRCSNKLGIATENIEAFYIIPESWAIDNLDCIYRQPFASLGEIQGTVKDDFKIKAELIGIGSGYITSTDQSKLSLGGGSVNIYFDGMEFQANQRIKQIEYKLLWQDGAFKYLINEDALSLGNDALNKFKNSIAACSNIYNTNCFETAIDNFNNKINNEVLSNKNDDFESMVGIKSGTLNFNTIDSKIDSNRGEMRVELSSGAHSYPVLTIDIDGELLSIKKLKGEPNIIECVDDIDTKAGREEEMKGQLIIENKGTNDATFYVYITCDNPKINAITQQRVDIGKDAEEIINVVITGESSIEGATEKATCKVKVEDRGSDNYDECEFKVNLGYAETLCYINQKSCSKDKTQLSACNSQGDDFDILKTCKSDEYCGLNVETGELDCIKGEAPTISDEEDENGELTIRVECLARNKPGSYRYEWIEKEYETCGKNPLCYVGIMDKTVIKEPYCKDNFKLYFILGGIGVFLLVIIIIIILTRRKPYYQKPYYRRGRRR